MALEETEGVIPAGGTPCMITLEDGSQVPGYTFQCERQSELPTAEHLAAATLEQLIEELLESSFNMSHVYCNSPENYEDIVRTNPYVQEILSRNGGVAALLACYEANSDLDYKPKSALESLLHSGAVREAATSLELEKIAVQNEILMSANDVDSFYIKRIKYTRSSEYNFTPGRLAVSLYDAERQLNAEEIAEYKTELISHRSATCLAEPNAYYNCHSYAWYQANTSNRYWIPSAETYTYDPHIVCSPTAKVGMRVLYSKNETYVHSGVVSQIKSDGTILVESKWGQGSLIQHEIDDVPDTYIDGALANTTFWTITSHSNKLSYNAASHTYKCSICGYARTEKHIFNINQKCITCGYKKSDPSILDSLRNRHDQLGFEDCIAVE